MLEKKVLTVNLTTLLTVLMASVLASYALADVQNSFTKRGEMTIMPHPRWNGLSLDHTTEEAVRRGFPSTCTRNATRQICFSKGELPMVPWPVWVHPDSIPMSWRDLFVYPNTIGKVIIPLGME